MSRPVVESARICISELTLLLAESDTPDGVAHANPVVLTKLYLTCAVLCLCAPAAA